MASLFESPSIAAFLTNKALKLILQLPITVFSAHNLKDLLKAKTLPLLSPTWIQEIHLLFIENPDIALSPSPLRNPASLLPSLAGSQTLHSYPQVIDFCLSPRDGLQDQPLPLPDLTLFVDGSSTWVADRHQPCSLCGSDPRCTRPLQGYYLSKSRTLCTYQSMAQAQGKWVNIYTDCKYAFLITDSHAVIWQERGFLTTKGSPTVNAVLITKLLQTLSLPKKVAVIHYRRHQSTTDPVSRANNKADQTSRQLANQAAAQLQPLWVPLHFSLSFFSNSFLFWTTFM